MEPILLSGIQPSGPLHIGNYLGALKNFVELQNTNQYRCLFFIADLHSLTEEFSPAERKQQTLDLIASYLAAGLDPKRSTLFLQSGVPAHSELAWILNTITPFGELRRMIQFKEKSGDLQNIPARLRSGGLEQEEKIDANVGLFDYPVLMAADILLYDVQFVPVGDDQLQHLELARTLARKFNHTFGETFIEPRALLTKTPRVMNLQNPSKKMSKSQPAGCLFLDDPPEEINRKVMQAVTDSGKEVVYDPQGKPGIANLLEIYAGVSNKNIPDAERDFSSKNYSHFKKSLARIIAKHFASFRRKKERLLARPERLQRAIIRGNKTANRTADEKIAAVKEKLGLFIK